MKYDIFRTFWRAHQHTQPTTLQYNAYPKVATRMIMIVSYALKKPLQFDWAKVVGDKDPHTHLKAAN